MKMMNRAIQGCAAGFLATIPMTGIMQALHKKLPRSQRYPLPPRQITMRLVNELQPPERLKEEEKTAMTWVGHFGYGALAGVAYSGLESRVQLPALLKGLMFGLAVYGGSYLGWLPLFRVHKPATQVPRERNFILVLSHLAWGACTGILMRALQSKAKN
jgi:uncharacterized membrane protein YagU involved in acid resistance